MDGAIVGLEQMITELEQLDDALPQLVYARLVAVLRPIAPQLEQLARDTHGWTNRSFAAERGLRAGVIEDVAGLLVQLYLEHGPDVDYGYWLETRFEGRYGVIIQAIEGIMPEIRAALRG